MGTPGKATKKEKKKPVPVKTCLNNPYDLKWKPLEKGHARFILKTVTDKLVSLDLRKQNVQVSRKWRGKKTARKGASDSVGNAEPTQESKDRGCSDSVENAEPTQESKNRGCSDLVNEAEPTQESKNRGCLDLVKKAEPTQESKNRGCLDLVNKSEPSQESKNRGCSDSVKNAEPTQESKNRGCSDSVKNAEPTQESKNRGWTDKRLRNELAIGINEVTKGLERNELGLVLVCDSVKPAHMTSHLISLSQTRSVPACQVPGLSASLSGPLGLTSVLALGFKRQSGTFADTIATLVSKVPPLDVAWVPTGTGVSEAGVVQVSGETLQQKCGDEETERGRKRKLEDSSEVKKEVVILLQPLRVKKIIPNPSKSRKPKIKKAKK